MSSAWKKRNLPSREVVKLNDEKGVVEVIEGRAEDIDLPQQVDIIIRSVLYTQNMITLFLQSSLNFLGKKKNELKVQEISFAFVKFRGKKGNFSKKYYFDLIRVPGTPFLQA